MRCPSSSNKAGWGGGDTSPPPLPLLFVSFRASTDWTMPSHTGERNLSYQVHPFKSIWKHSHRHTQKQCLIWQPVAHSNWYIKLTVLLCFISLACLLFSNLWAILSPEGLGSHFPLCLETLPQVFWWLTYKCCSNVTFLMTPTLIILFTVIT